jgi:RND family efflux transporter MFP subunit
MDTRIKPSLFLATLLWSLTGSPLLCQAEELQAISTPSVDITLSFVVAGRLAEVLVKEGDLVVKDQLLANLDDKPERIQAEQLKVQAEDRTQIMAAEAELAQKKVDLEKLELAKSKGAASDWEIEHMRLGVRIAELSLKAATLEHQQYQRRYAQAVSQLERMRLVSPIEGRVEKLVVKPGEAAKTLGPVIQLVKVDPLWIDVPVPLTQAKQLALGQNVLVTFPGASPVESPNGRIIHLSSVADAASDTLRVRIEVANPLGRPAGERVMVRFPQVKEGDDYADYKEE